MMDGIINKEQIPEDIAKMSDEEILAIPNAILKDNKYNKEYYYECVYCNKIFEFRKWKEHSRQHNIYKCPECGRLHSID